MYTRVTPIIITLALLVAGTSLFGGDTQLQPSPYYLKDGIQYFPHSPEVPHQTPSRSSSTVLGDLLFTDVVSVHFIGLGHPANPDGSLGGLAAGDDGTELRVYERYIVQDATDADGTTFRRLHAYDKIGKIEQRIPREGTRTKKDVH